LDGWVTRRADEHERIVKKRHLYALLWGLPGLLVGVIATMFVVGGLAGMLWLFVFGDNAWPSFAGPVLMALGIVVFLLSWIGLVRIGYRLGKRLETVPGVNWSHVLLSIGLTVVFVLLIVGQQFSVGNLGPKSDSVLCSDYCYQRGYSGSGMPPADSGERSCSCYDASGSEAIEIPLESIGAEAVK
jgi:hypothetical protein